MAAAKKPAKKTVSTAAKPALKSARLASKPAKRAQGTQVNQDKDIVKMQVVVFTILSAIFLVMVIIKYT